MTKIIKEVTMKEIKRHQTENLPQVDLVQLTIDLQSRIIINCSVGIGYSQAKVPFELHDGSVIDSTIQDSITHLL